MNENVNDTLAEYVLGNPDIFIKILERYKERGEKLSYLDSITSSRGLVTRKIARKPIPLGMG